MFRENWQNPCRHIGVSPWYNNMVAGKQLHWFQTDDAIELTGCQHIYISDLFGGERNSDGF